MRINPLYRVAISLVLATLGILAASGFINYRMTKTYDQLSLEFFNKQLQKPIDAENAPPEDYDPEPALWDLRIETRKLMDTAILSTDKNLNVRGISYILKKKKNVTFSEWRETSEKHDQFPDELIKKIVERKKAHKFLMPVYYWIDNGMPTATSVVPIGRFDYSGYLLVHASLLDVLSALAVSYTHLRAHET